nr:putative protein [Melanopsichium pennsylvanicum 4]
MDLDPFSSLSSSITMPPQYGNGCALTILKGDTEHPINQYAPIHSKEDPLKTSATASQSSRFAASFSNLRSASQAASTGFDSSVNIHAISDNGVLLPFLDRPSEVKELLFDTKANESLMTRICRLFGGDLERPTQRGLDERWDEMLELLIELDRPLLDDEDWLARLESLVMERSPALWAQLARCLGADGLTLRPSAQPSSSRFDSWALPSRYMNSAHDNDSPLSQPSDVSSDGEDGHEDHTGRSLSVSVEPLEELPQSYSAQPAGKMQQSTLRSTASTAAPPTLLAPEPGASHPSDLSSHDRLSPDGELFAMLASHEDSATSNSLEDIMEEPGSSTQFIHHASRRPRSHSGRFAGLRISALSSSSPPPSRRTSNASELSAAARRDSSSSPLPTGTMSPAGLAPSSPGLSPSRATSTSFSKHRRLSMMMTQNNQSIAQHQHEQSKPDTAGAVSPKAPAWHRQRGVSEAVLGSHDHGHGSQQQSRRRAQSFARSFAELKSPAEQLEQLRAEHAKAESDRLIEGTHRIGLQDEHTTSAPAAPAGGLGLHGDDNSPSLLHGPPAARFRRGLTNRRRINSVSSRNGGSSTGSTSPSIPGLLPDGRTRHPSGSCGSRDLSESIAAFRATMGLSISPSPSEHNFSEKNGGTSDADKSSDSTTRKRKDLFGAELPKPTSKTADTAEAKVSRKGSPLTHTEEQAHFDRPKHMQELQSRNRSSGTSGSGLALGGGFSLAKSGGNFRKQSHDSAPTSQDGWRGSFPTGNANRVRDSFRSPPAVHRRPGGFVSLAQEYEKARRGRRASETAFSINSNALASSPGSSIASLDVVSPRQGSGFEKSVPRLELSLATHGGGGKMNKAASTPDIVKGDPTPKADPVVGLTPRASFVSSSSTNPHVAILDGHGYPFPNVASKRAGNGPNATDLKLEASESGPELGPATPLSPLQACRTRLIPSLGASGSTSSSGDTSPRSPTIVFPISPNPSISRAVEFQKALSTRHTRAAFERIASLLGTDTADSIKELITTSERSQMPDEQLLEEVGLRLGLVDHEKAREVGGREAEEADMILAEEGYEQKWRAFVDLCRSLGVGQYELGCAKRRCGPAIDLSG